MHSRAVIPISTRWPGRTASRRWKYRLRTALLVALAWLVAPSASSPPATATPAAVPDSTPVRRDADGFQQAVAPYAFRFPHDHAAHPAFRTEWWYYNGHLGAGDRHFGYQLAFFRMALPAPAARSGGAVRRPRDVIFRHLALTDESVGRFRYDDRAERQVLDRAGADSTRYLVWLGDDYAGLEADGATHRLVGRTAAFALDLHLNPERALVVHGRDGVSQKSAGAGNASHYYSFTRLATRGRLVLGPDTLEVQGRSWMDHEYSSDRLRGRLAGWDWFSMRLDDGRDLMLYRLRRKGGGLDTCSSGTLVESDGRARHVPYADFDSGPTHEWGSPHSGGRYPSGWIVRIPNDTLELRLVPTLPDQELVVKSMGGLAYWEGSVSVRGTRAGRPVAGEGYVELTGYAGLSPFETSALDSLLRLR